MNYHFVGTKFIGFGTIIARCLQRTNIAVTGMLESSRGLKVFDVSDLHQIPNESFEPVREHSHALQY